MARLQLKKLVKIYPNGFEAVHGIDLDVADGEFMVFVGPSGCAKSTTLRMIAGLEMISSGEIVIGDRVVNTLSPGSRGIAMVFQNYALYPHMKVKNNLAFGLKLAGTPKDEIRAATDQVANTLEIEELLERLPKELSGGQAQRVALGRALIKEPEVFLFDEPLSNLDAKLRASMRVRITDLHKRLLSEGKHSTVVYVTHDQIEAMTMGDRICVMKEGHIMQVADPVTLYDKPENAFVAGFIGTPEMNLLKGTLSEANNPVVTIGSQSVRVGPEAAERLDHIDGDIIFGIRPQHFSVVPEGAEDSFHGEVTALEFMGHEVYMHVMIEGHSVIAVIPGEDYDPSKIRGSKIGLKAISQKTHIFDAASGKNISLPKAS